MHSSRRIEERLRSDVNFMLLAGQARPDHKTIAEFRRRHLAAVTALFLDIRWLCQKAGLATLGRVAIDGTKLKAIVEEAEAVDAAEDAAYGDARGDELPPEELRRRETRLAKIREAKAALEAEARERSGDPDALPEQRAQRNFTDPESRIMLSKPDGFIYGYNAQIAVDDGHQVIVATSLTGGTSSASTQTTSPRGTPRASAPLVPISLRCSCSLTATCASDPPLLEKLNDEVPWPFDQFSERLSDSRWQGCRWGSEPDDRDEHVCRVRRWSRRKQHLEFATQPKTTREQTTGLILPARAVPNHDLGPPRSRCPRATLCFVAHETEDDATPGHADLRCLELHGHTGCSDYGRSSSTSERAGSRD